MSKLRLVVGDEGISCEEVLRWCDTRGPQTSNFPYSLVTTPSTLKQPVYQAGYEASEIYILLN